MKTATVTEVQANLTTMLESDESVLVTTAGKPTAVLYPLGVAPDMPVELRRRLFLELSAAIGDELAAAGVTEEQIASDFSEHQKRRSGQ